MRVTLVGADFEENLGLGMIAAVAEAAGHDVRIVAFNEPARLERVVADVLDTSPDVVGLSMQFQHRAHEFLSLARRLRAAGFRGHLTAGGQFPTLASREVLGPDTPLDSVVLYEGEETFPALLSALAEGRPLADVAGLALPSTDGPCRTADRRLPEDLDLFPYPRRYRGHAKHFGVPFIPVMGSRGCWGKCSYCAITSFYRDARAHGGGLALRLRSPEHIAGELALLWHASGGPAIFCFHDDNFVLPRASDTLERVRAIRAALDEYGVGRFGIIGKARPDTLTPELARELAALGVIRLYVGVENASEHGAADLRRGTQTAHVREALRACREAGIFVCYNLLVFEPASTLADLRENVAFIRAHADHPVNFCRAEPYFGTPLHRELAETQDLGGSYLGWNYRIGDDRAELAFRIASSAFRERNFASDGVANRFMGLGYAAKVVSYFHGAGSSGLASRAQALSARALEVTRSISRDTADFLEETIALAETLPLDDRESIERETALLGLRIAASDARWHAVLDGLFADLEAFAREPVEAPRARRAAPPRKLVELARHVALGSALAVWTANVQACSSRSVDPVPPDAGSDSMVVDPLPVDAGPDSMVVDPPPADAGFDAGWMVDPLPDDAGFDAGWMVDPPPFDAGMPVDPPPRDAGRPVDPLPPDLGIALAPAHRGGARLAIVDQWRDSSSRAVRTADLALFDPPVPRLVTSPSADGTLRVHLEGIDPSAGVRWESDGDTRADGHEVEWTPRDPDDRLRVAVRSRGGVAVVSLRAPRLS
jgi:radical SAM superfamily enzyme YgiQ (UPF0313 family)